MSAHAAASAVSRTSSPAAFAFAHDALVSAQADADLDATVAQVLRVRVPLAAVSDDGDLLALEQRRVRVLVRVDVQSHSYPLVQTKSASEPRAQPTLVALRGERERLLGAAASTGEPRNIATPPVRTTSLIPNGRSRSMNAAILSSVPVTSTTYDSARDVDDLAAEDVDDAHHLAARLFVRRDLDQHQLALDVRAVLKSLTLITLTSLLRCLVICSSTRSSPLVTRVMRDTVASVVRRARGSRC